MRTIICDRKIGKEKTQQNKNLTLSKDHKTITTCQEPKKCDQDACDRNINNL